MRLGLDLNPFGSFLARLGFGLGLGAQTRVFPIPPHARPVGPAQTHQGHMVLGLFFTQCLSNMADVAVHFWFSVLVCLGEFEASPFGQLLVMAYQNSDTLMDCYGFNSFVTLPWR